MEHRVLDERAHVAPRRMIAAHRVHHHRAVVRQRARVVGDEQRAARARGCARGRSPRRGTTSSRGTRTATPSARSRADRGRNRRRHRERPHIASARQRRHTRLERQAACAGRSGTPACAAARCGARARAARRRLGGRARRDVRAARALGRERSPPPRRGRRRRRGTRGRDRRARSSAGASGTRGSASPYQSSSSSSVAGVVVVVGHDLGLRSRDVGGAILGRDAEEVEDRALDRQPRREAELAAGLRAVGDAEVEQEVEERRRRADELRRPQHLATAGARRAAASAPARGRAARARWCRAARPCRRC